MLLIVFSRNHNNNNLYSTLEIELMHVYELQSTFWYLEVIAVEAGRVCLA